MEAKLQQYFYKKDYTEADMVQMQGTPVTSLYYVCSGEFHVFSTKAASSLGVPSPAAAGRSLQHGPDQGRAAKFEIPTRRMSMAAVGDVGRKAYLHRKLTAGFVEGVDMFCGDGLGTMDAYTSVECKVRGSLLHLTPEQFLRMRREDPELCVALLLSATSSREMLRRRHVLHRFEPGPVEIIDGVRRKFTTTFCSRDLDLECRKNRFNPNQILASFSDRVRLRAIDDRAGQLVSPANIIDRSGTALV